MSVVLAWVVFTHPLGSATPIVDMCEWFRHTMLFEQPPTSIASTTGKYDPGEPESPGCTGTSLVERTQTEGHRGQEVAIVMNETVDYRQITCCSQDPAQHHKRLDNVNKYGRSYINRKLTQGSRKKSVHTVRLQLPK